MKTKRVVVVGDSAFAEVAYECFTHDSEYEVVGFAVEEAYRKKKELFGLPVIAFEDMEARFPPQDVYFYVAVTYSQLNRVRARLYGAAKEKGYRPASYISSRAFVWHNAMLGEHCFIFEDNTVQPFVTIGNNVVLWSGNHIGHHSCVQDHCFVASQVVISGFCSVGAYSFLGVNATIANNVKIGADNWIGLGVSILHDTDENVLFKGVEAEPAKISARRFFKVKES